MTHKNKLVVIVGFPASGKSTYAENLKTKIKTSIIVSRDDNGGKIEDLLPVVENHLENGLSVIVDNTHMTKASRKIFVDLGNSLNIQVEAHHIVNSIEDSQMKVLHRMYQKYGYIFMTGKTKKGTEGYDDPNVFLPAVLFSARKHFQEPEDSEGFAKIVKVKASSLSLDGRKYRNKAIFFDIDGTLRETSHLEHKYPLNKSEVVLLKDAELMKNVLKKYIDDGYKLVGVSNQSGVSKKIISDTQVAECMEETRRLLGFTEKEFPIIWCPHQAVPVACYCRKPQIGMLMYFVENMKLNPKKCLMVGDRTVDETTASRMGVPYIHCDTFWKL